MQKTISFAAGGDRKEGEGNQAIKHTIKRRANRRGKARQQQASCGSGRETEVNPTCSAHTAHDYSVRPRSTATLPLLRFAEASRERNRLRTGNEGGVGVARWGGWSGGPACRLWGGRWAARRGVRCSFLFGYVFPDTERQKKCYSSDSSSAHASQAERNGGYVLNSTHEYIVCL